MLIGVDFDNTIVCYDKVFHSAAVERGLIPERVPPSKGRVRDYLREAGREDDWTELQGYIYGPGMKTALPFPGVLEFFARCVRSGVEVFVISHRTRHPFLGPRYDLHLWARNWLDDNGFLDPGRVGMPAEKIFFEFTKEDKLRRIAEAGCTHFIDDLPEFLAEPDFPAGVERILFDPGGNCRDETRFPRAGAWKEIENLVFGESR